MTTTFAPQDEALWAAIAAFPMDDPNASMPFTKRLARDHLWTDAYAQTVVEEYKKFVYLMATAQPGVTTTPSEDVDEAWHLHMVYTRSYWDDLCTKVLGKALHHGPTGGKEQTGGFKEAYADTLKRYEQSFGPVSNTLVWPSVKDRFGHKNGAQYLTVSTQDFRVVTKTKAHLVWAAFIVIMVAGLGSMMPQQSLAFWGSFVGMLVALMVLGVPQLKAVSLPSADGGRHAHKYATPSKPSDGSSGCGSTAAAVAGASDGGGGCGGCGGCG